jgi:hypothetical protein
MLMGPLRDSAYIGFISMASRGHPLAYPKIPCLTIDYAGFNLISPQLKSMGPLPVFNYIGFNSGSFQQGVGVIRWSTLKYYVHRSVS